MCGGGGVLVELFLIVILCARRLLWNDKKSPRHFLSFVRGDLPVLFVFR